MNQYKPGKILNFQCSEEAWDKIFEINVKAAFLLTREVVPHLEKRKGSNIVYVSSIAGFQPFAVRTHEFFGQTITIMSKTEGGLIYVEISTTYRF